MNVKPFLEEGKRVVDALSMGAIDSYKNLEAIEATCHNILSQIAEYGTDLEEAIESNKETRKFRYWDKVNDEWVD